MEITKQNYEEYALDYIEGTLSAEEREAFGRFLETDPQAAADIRSLQESMPVLAPDLSVGYEGKAALKRKASIRPWVFRIGTVAAVLLVGLFVFNRYDAETGNLPVRNNTPLADDLRNDMQAKPEKTDAVRPADESTAGTEATLLAEATSPSIPSSVKTPAEKAAPTIKTEPRQKLAPDVKNQERTLLPAKNETAAGTPHSVEGTREVREVITVIAEQETLLLDEPEELKNIELQEPQQVRLAEALSVGRVVSVREEFVIEPAQEVLMARETRDYFAEEGNQAGFLNVLNRKGFKRIAAGILTPLSELSPIKVYETNEERVVEFASIPISRKSNRAEDNQ